MIAMSQIAAGEMLLESFYNAYDVSTITKLSQDKAFQAMGPQQQLAYVKSLPSLAALRKTETLKLASEIGADFSSAVKWALNYQAELCPNGQNSTVLNRRGFLFEQGICVDNSEQTYNSLAVLDSALQGPVNISTYDDNGNVTGSIKINPFYFFSHLPQDLKQVLPASVDSQGNVLSWSDKTFGGLFPDGNAPIFKSNVGPGVSSQQ